MSGFELLINQERPIRILTSLLRNRTLPHALLFTGAAGVGKQIAALALAMVCNCQGQTSGSDVNDGSEQGSVTSPIGPCGTCKSCRKIAAGHHPDIIQIKPSGPFIKIEQIRALLQTFSMKPYEAKIRVVIMAEAHSMNAAASNALLKILEEPPDRSLLVLLATGKSQLLPTIASRCQPVRFNRISKEYIASFIGQEYGLQPQESKIIAIMSKGSLSKAQEMVAGNWMLRRKWLLAEIQRLTLQPMARLLGLAEKLAREKEALAECLEIIKTWLRDLIVIRFDTHNIINLDVADQIKAASHHTDIAALLLKMEAIQKTQDRLTANPNLRLGMERLLIKLAQPHT